MAPMPDVEPVPDVDDERKMPGNLFDWISRALITRSRTCADVSPTGPLNIFTDWRGTSICRSMRSMIGPEIFL